MALTSGAAAAAHQAIPGSTFRVMSGLGPFPMSEDPERFMTHLRPVLEQILALPDRP